jgi:hypothetical protein
VWAAALGLLSLAAFAMHMRARSRHGTPKNRASFVWWMIMAFSIALSVWFLADREVHLLLPLGVALFGGVAGYASAVILEGGRIKGSSGRSCLTAPERARALG